MASAALPVAQLLVAIGAVLAGLHSFYRGTLGEFVDYIRMIPKIDEKVDHVEDRQEDMSDAIVLLGHAATRDGIEPDPESLEQDLRDGDTGPSRYARKGFYRGGGETEDEQEDGEQRAKGGFHGTRLPEVQEPE